MKDLRNLVQTDGIDLATFGQRLRHLRRTRGLTLTELGERVGRAPSALSLLENGRREPKLSLIEQLASALSVPVADLARAWREGIPSVLKRDVGHAAASGVSA